MGKAYEKYKIANPGIPAWYPTHQVRFWQGFQGCLGDYVKMSTFVSAFKQSGICPVSRHAINKMKLAPSPLFSNNLTSEN